MRWIIQCCSKLRRKFTAGPFHRASLICRPCERRMNNFKAFKSTINETQTPFERTKRCIEMSASVRQALKSSKVNEPLVVRSRRGINLGDEQPSGNKISTAILYLFFFFLLALAIAMVTFSCLVNFFYRAHFSRTPLLRIIM